MKATTKTYGHSVRTKYVLRRRLRTIANASFIFSGLSVLAISLPGNQWVNDAFLAAALIVTCIGIASLVAVIVVEKSTS